MTDIQDEMITILLATIKEVKQNSVETQAKLIVIAENTLKVYQDIFKELQNQTMILKHRGKLQINNV